MSVVIPVWHDHDELARLLDTFRFDDRTETIVVVARQEISRYGELEHRFPSVRWTAADRGRGTQMDAGAAIARGRWLLFLHADCRLPADWLEAIIDADRVPQIVGGAFRFAMDVRHWRARALEFAVTLRVAVFRLPYGDQALFVRRSVFDSVGGFRGLPLMEDVDLVRRLKKRGRLYMAPAVVTTSARRWEREGWIRRSARNLMLMAQYRLGRPISSLVRDYYGRHPAAVVMMARAPWTGGKTRLRASDDASHAELRRALFEDTIDVVRSLPDVDSFVACEPAVETHALRQVVGSDCEVFGQHGASLGDRLAHAFEHVFRRGYCSVVIVGSDLPDLPSDFLLSSVASLTSAVDCMVIGPARDGGYYLIGLNRPHTALFQGIDWGTDRVLRQTLERAAGLGLRVVQLAEWSDVDEAGDLERFHLPGPSAPRTREWIKTTEAE